MQDIMKQGEGALLALVNQLPTHNGIQAEKFPDKILALLAHLPRHGDN